MKKIKLFIVRNYQRCFRLLVSFFAVGCVLISSAAVFALSSFVPVFGAPNYFCAASSANNNSLVGSADNPNDLTFGVKEQEFSFVLMNSEFPDCDSIRIVVPFELNVPEGDFWQGSFRVRPVFLNSDSFVYPIKNFALRLVFNSSSGAVVFTSEGVSSNGEINVSIPSCTSVSSVDFSFSFDTVQNVTFRNFRIYFSNFNFTSGTSDEFAGDNISAFLQGVGTFFSRAVSFLSDCLAIIVSNPALTVLCIAMPICGFAVVFLRRFIHL